MATVRRLCCISLVSLPLGLLGGAGPAFAAGTHSGCNAPAGSAISQYCETIPTAGGKQTPHVGSPSIAKTLPHRAVRTLSAAPTPVRSLLSIPAPQARAHARIHGHRVGGSAHHSLRAASTSLWSISFPVAIVLLGVALALGLIALAQRRRRSPPA